MSAAHGTRVPPFLTELSNEEQEVLLTISSTIECLLDDGFTVLLARGFTPEALEFYLFEDKKDATFECFYRGTPAPDWNPPFPVKLLSWLDNPSTSLNN